ncbi:MAG: dihydroxyacetone kinase phosphoryl donor subunit DhaM [Streptosporangiaceae bacterium]
MIGLVLVAHSADLASGLRDVVAQMAPDVRVGLAGGAEGGLGTTPDAVTKAIGEADSVDGVVILYDLGSGQMSAEMALELIDPDQRERVHVSDAPLVEGAVAASVAASGRASLEDVLAELRSLEPGGGPAPQARAEDEARPAQRRTFEVVNPLGIHARPAAQIVRALAGLDADVRVCGDDTEEVTARSVVALMRATVPAGGRATVSASGPDAAVALDRLAELFEAGFGELEEEPVAATGAEHGEVGTPAAPGQAYGPAAWLRVAAPAVPDTPGGGTRAELARIADAVSTVRAELGDASGVLGVHRTVLDDPELTDAVERGLASGRNAARSWWDAIQRVRGQLAGVPDPLIAARAADIEDVGRRVLAELTGEALGVDVPAASVVLAEDLLPSQVPELFEQGVAGVALAAGGARSHAAVLARSFGLPMVVGAGTLLDGVPGGTPLLVDGDSGRVELDPPRESVVELRRSTERSRRAYERALVAAHEPVRLADGGAVTVLANVASVDNARLAREHGADGVGLLRTEFLFSGRDVPGEDEQVERLAEVIAACGPGRLVVRTIDLGGDKTIPALALDPVRHGPLGQRGLRLCLARPELFRPHLRALLRACADRALDLMFPFVSSPQEVRAARDALAAAGESLRADGTAAGEPSAVGVMVEIPALVLRLEDVLPSVDFVSIGSNDLVQYLSAAGRDNDAVASAYSAGEDLLPRVASDVCAAAARAGVPVAVCGDAAGDPGLARLLTAAGVRELSVAPRLVPQLKQALRDR